MMKKFLFLFLGLLVVVSANASENQGQLNGGIVMSGVSVKEYEGVKKALNNYLEAGRQADSNILRPSVYKDAIIYSAPKGKIDGGAITALFDYLDGNPKATELESEITTVDVVGNVAYAKIETNNWHGARYTDMFLLVKEGDDWKILTKVFHTH